MQINKTTAIYFSATNTTKKIVRLIAGQITSNFAECDITQHCPEKDIPLSANDLLVVGMPVYFGRIPPQTLEALNRFKGNNTPAIIVCVYGNREYDDALLELHDTVRSNGFKVISAGAFIAQHSVMPSVGTGRPDMHDKTIIELFTTQSITLLSSVEIASQLPDISIKGNRPYRKAGKLPFSPRANRHCDQCGVCAKLCPTGAIDNNHPRHADKEKCIACGRCIVICPSKARHYRGVVYKIASWKFTKDNSMRKAPETFFATNA